MLTSSSSFALIGHRTPELHYFILLLFIFYFNLTVVRGRRSREGRMKTEEKTQVSEAGFEPATFRSCVAHSIRYATETPPIPDVLLVLVAPKYINRNVTTTLQSRFTPTPTPQATHSSFIILFYYIYIYFFYIYFFVYYLFVYFLFILFYFIFVKLLNTSHCSPKFGLYRFFNIFLQNPYLLTWRIWGENGFFP